MVFVAALRWGFPPLSVRFIRDVIAVSVAFPKQYDGATGLQSDNGASHAQKFALAERECGHINSVPPPSSDPPCAVELWDESDREPIERLLARASSAALARAIFEAGQTYDGIDGAACG
jgi:hypothetical protein